MSVAYDPAVVDSVKDQVRMIDEGIELAAGGKYGASMSDFYGTAAKEGRQAKLLEAECPKDLKRLSFLVTPK